MDVVYCTDDILGFDSLVEIESSHQPYEKGFRERGIYLAALVANCLTALSRSYQLARVPERSLKRFMIKTLERAVF